MEIAGKLLENIDPEDIIRLISSNILENRMLEYKASLTLEKGDERKEFLADVSAMANRDGGIIVFGIKERKSEGAIELVGLHVANTDQEIAKMEDLISSGLEPKINYRIKPLEVQGKLVIIISVKRSWNIPSMVTYNCTNKFYSRRDSGKYLMDVYQIKDAIMFASTMVDRASQFREQRFSHLMASAHKPALLVNLVPLGYYDFLIDLSEREKIQKLFRLFSFSSKSTVRSNIDGLEVSSVFGDETTIKTQLFRNGSFEFITNRPFYEELSGHKDWIRGSEFEKIVIQSLKRAIAFLKEENFTPPVALFLGLANVGDVRIKASDEYSDVIGQSKVILPSQLLNDFADSIALKLKPIFDIFYQGGNLDKSPFFDERGWAFEEQVR